MSGRPLFTALILLLAISCSHAPGPEETEKDERTQSASSGVSRPGRLPDSADPAFYYAPKKLPRDNPPLPGRVVEAQKKQILKDLTPARAWIREYRRDAAREERLQRAWLRRQKNYPLIPKVLSPETGQEVERHQNHFRWGKVRSSFFALAKNYEFKRASGIVHNIGALNELNQLLKSCSVQLIVMLVPDPDRLAASALLSEGRTAEDPATVQCAATLLEYGIEAVYADPALLAASRASEQLFLYPSRVPGTDLWSFLADLAADRIEARFGKDAFAETGPMHYRQVQEKTVFGNNCRWPEGVDCGDHRAGEVVEGRQVLRDGQPFRPDPASKILVIGGETLDLPGPGHTFTGLLSMRLRYAVDEMIPGRGIWLHNLPLILQSDPVRWLGGKQVCLMLVPASMLEKGILPNLRTQSELYAGLGREKTFFRFPPVKNNAEIILPAPVPGERLFEEKTAWNRFWQNASGTQFMIAEDDRPQTAAELTVPEPYTGAPFTFCADVLNYPGQSVTLLVNGRKIPLPVEDGVPCPARPAAAELPAGTTSIKLEISGRRGDLIRLGEIRLCR